MPINVNKRVVKRKIKTDGASTLRRKKARANYKKNKLTLLKKAKAYRKKNSKGLKLRAKKRYAVLKAK